MIVRYPDFPAVEGSLKLPRPAVFLLGSYHPRRGYHGQWHSTAALRLQNLAGVVLYGVNTRGYDPDFVAWTFFWLAQVDLVVAWIDDPETWSEFELGFVVGAGAAELHMGCPDSLALLRRGFEIVSNDARGAIRIYSDLDALLDGARARLRQGP